MKFPIALYLFILIAIGACSEVKPDPVSGFIPGTYIRYAEHEFGHEYDTLVITAIGNQFSIQRKWKYERVLDGQLIEPEYKKTTMTGILNRGILTEEQTGAYYSFDLDAKCLYSGDTRYDKVNASSSIKNIVFSGEETIPIFGKLPIAIFYFNRKKRNKQSNSALRSSNP
jgi:hypothetical protein